MPRYIDEENLIRRMHAMAKDNNPPYDDIFQSFAFKVFKDLLASEATADVQEVKHARWVFKERYITCSECGCQPYKGSMRVDFDYLWKICPECGAKMDGKGGE